MAVDSISHKTIQPIRPKWKGTLTDRERFNRQMHYQPVDRCFNMEFGYWDENFHRVAAFLPKTASPTTKRRTCSSTSTAPSPSAATFG